MSSRGRKVGHLWIKDCQEKTCKSDGRSWHYHTPNPRGQAMKGVEMTVRRALAIIEVFDDLGPGQDWTDADPKKMREALGESYDPRQAVLPELWERYKKGTLHEQTVALSENLVMEDLAAESKKEIKDGIRRISKR